jgi:hypothetical protein
MNHSLVKTQAYTVQWITALSGAVFRTSLLLFGVVRVLKLFDVEMVENHSEGRYLLLRESYKLWFRDCVNCTP